MRLILKKIFASFGFQILSLKRYKDLISSKKTYAQIGEDVIVSYVFALKGIKKPSYLDIGANDPKFINNTFLFYQRGSRGVNIDANPFCIEKFNEERRDDINLNIGITEQQDALKFYVMEDDSLSTFSQEEYANLLNLGQKLKKIITVETTTINKVLKDYCDNKMPDFLSLDTEGLDYDIIKQIEFDFLRPKVICLESSDHSQDGVGVKRTELISYVLGKDYFEYGSTYLNSIFVDKQWFFNNNG